MGWCNRWNRTGLIGALSIAFAVASAQPAGAVPPGDVVDDEPAVELLEAARDALEDGDDQTYNDLVSVAQRGDVWLPDLAVEALVERDSEYISEFAYVLDADTVDIADIAYDVVATERNDLAAIPVGAVGTVEQQEALRDSDIESAAFLQLFTRRGVALPPETRAALELIPADGEAPTLADYDVALEQLDVLAGNVIEPAAPVAEPSAEVAPVATTAAVATVPVTAPPVTVVETPESSTSSSQVPLLLALGIGTLALVIGVISMRRGRRNDELADIAYTDGLTGLKNRRRMDADVNAQAARGDQPTATLMVDIDHFKSFNDTHGHAMGDTVLQLVGETMSRQFRSTDIPYRYGGEEFCVLLNDATPADAADAAERLRVAIEEIKLPIPGQITASIGVSIGPAASIPVTIKQADEALYDAKEAGRNRVAFAAS